MIIVTCHMSVVIRLYSGKWHTIGVITSLVLIIPSPRFFLALPLFVFYKG